MKLIPLNKLNQRILKTFIITAATLVCLTVSLNHELWTDEGYMLISSLDYTIIELLDYYRFNGFVPVHSFFIKILAGITDNQIIVLKSITIFSYLLCCLLIINIKEIPLFVKILLLFSYPLLAEYAIINRHYIWYALAIFYLILINKKKYNFTLLSLGLLNSTGPFGVIIGVAFKASNYSFFLNNLKNNKLSSLIYLIFFLISIYYIFPFDQNLNFTKFRTGDSWYGLPGLEKFNYVFDRIFLSINYTQDILDSDNIWSLYNSNYYIYKFFLAYGIIQFLILLALLINEDKSSFFFILIIFFLFLTAFIIQGRGDWRHYFIFSIIFYCLSLKIIFFHKKTNIFKSIYKLSFIATLILSNIFSISFITKDLFYDFSQGYNVALFLKKNHIKCNDITSYPLGASNSWVPYMEKNCKPFQFGLGGNYSFHKNLAVGRSQKYNNADLLNSINTNYIILKCEMNKRYVDPCKKNIEFYTNLKTYNKKNKIFRFNSKTLNGYEKFVIFKIYKAN